MTAAVAGRAATGSAILVQLDRHTAQVLRQDLPPDTTVEELSDARTLIERAEAEAARWDVVLLGAELPDPIALAQRIHAIEPTVALLILAHPARLPLLRQSILFTPLLGEAVECAESTDAALVAIRARDALTRARQRRHYRHTLEAVNPRLATLAPLGLAAEQYLERVLHHAPIGVLAVDAHGGVVALNPRAIQLLGRAEHPAVGLPLSEWLPREDRPTLARLLAEALERGREAAEQFSLPGPEHRELVLELTVAPLPTREGPRLALVLIQDITARVQAQREQERMIRARDEFLASISHDLKTPLATIKGHTQLIHRAVSKSSESDWVRLAEWARRIDTATARMGNMIDQLLDITRTQLGQPITLDLRPTNLVSLVQQVVAGYEHESARHHFLVETSLPSLVATCDAARLERVMSNLLDNAVKYSPAGGEIRVRLGREGDEWATLSVQDQGVGIPSEDLPHIFERFRRGSNVVGRISGTGVGLAGAQQIVAEHGGTIEVSSQEGVGTTFSVRLPLRQ